MNARRFALQVFMAALAGVLLSSPGDSAAQSQPTGRENLLKNGSFEKGLLGWQVSAWRKSGSAAFDEQEQRDGRPTLRIHNGKFDDTLVTQKVTVKPNTRYRLSGYVKTQDMTPEKPGNTQGASLSVRGGFEHSKPVQKDQSWTKATVEFNTGDRTEVEVGPRVGHHGSLTSGTAWFADLKLEELGPSRR